MPFLIGIVGSIAQSSQAKSISSLAQHHARDNSVHKMSFDNGFVCAGYKNNEKHHFDHIFPLPTNQGMFVGKMFDRHSYAPAFFDASAVHAITHDPKIILKNWWGRYIGIVHNKNTAGWTLVRDPQGLLSVFYTIKPDGLIFATDLALLYDALEEKPSVNLTYFAQYVISKNYTSALTPLSDIQELLPGTGLHIHPDNSCFFENLWDLSSCRGSFITNKEAFEEELLATLRSSLKAWVDDSSGVCLELSGGTDSTGVLILLRDILPAHKNIIAVNLFDSRTPSSNEKEHAQEVATLCNVPLHYNDWQDCELLDPLPASWRPDKPSTFLLFHKAGQQLCDVAAQYNCSEIMDGQGGDHVFLAPRPLGALADYWLDKGLKGILSPMQELSAANRMSWWMLIRDTVKDIAHYYGKKKKTPSAIGFLDPSFVYAHHEDEFYLEKTLRNFYPGKIKHIESLFHAVSYSGRNQHLFGRTMTHPLLSQPIIELALKIPTYQSFKDGYDRIFFRKAVSRIKKPQALWRTIKGETTGSMAKSLAHYASDIHSILLQGRLVKDRLVNKEWLNEQMIKIRHGHMENSWPITKLLTAQLWLNQWQL